MNLPRASRFASLSFLSWAAVIAFLFVRECGDFLLSVVPLSPPFPLPAFAALKYLGVHAVRTAAALLFVVGTKPAGHRLLKIMGLPETDSETRRWTEVALGLSLWGMAAYGLAIAGFAKIMVYRLSSLAGVLFGMGIIFRRMNFFRSSLDPSFHRSGWRFTVWIVLFLGLAWAASALPETFGDALHYTLALPAAALREGKWNGIAGLCSSGFPALGESFYLWGLAWGDERYCKLLNWIVGISWLRLIYIWARARWAEEAGRWAALFLIATPVVSLYLWSATIDILCGFVLTAAFILWNELGENSQRHKMAAMFLCGCAGALKYTALLALPYFVLDYGFQTWRRRRIEWKQPVVYFLFFILPLLPWWIVNAIRYNNPFYPYAMSWLGHAPADVISGLSAMFVDQRGDARFLERLRIFFLWQITGVRTGRLGFIGPMILVLLPAAVVMFWRRLKESADGVALFFLTTLASLLLLTDRLRFIIPFLGVYAMALGGTIQWVGNRMAWERKIFHRVLGIVFFAQFAALLAVFIAFNQAYAPLAGRQSLEDYISRPHPLVYSHPSQGAYNYLKTAVEPKKKVYLLGETRSFRCPIPAYVNTLYDLPLFSRLFDQDITGRRFVEKLRSEGFTHLLVNPLAMATDVSPEYRSPENMARLNEIYQLLSPPVYQDEWVTLYKIG